MDDKFTIFAKNNNDIFLVYCQNKGQAPDDVVEIVNEAFTRLWINWRERVVCSDIANRKWMYNTINYIIWEYKRNNIKHQTENFDHYTEKLKSTVDVDEHLLYQELLDVILKNLNEKEQQLFRMAFLEKRSSEEIGNCFKINNQTLRTRVSRLRNKVKKIIKNLVLHKTV